MEVINLAQINIPVSDEERTAVAQAIAALLKLEHVSYMSRAMLTETSGIKDTKLRIVLQDMLDHKLIEMHPITDNPKRQRYLFVLTDAGKQLIIATQT